MTNKNLFLDFAESLKLVRKTRIEDFIEDKTVDDIYTDLLPNNGIINKLNLPRTTILVGRKGTGKSTIFQKSQKDLVKNKKCISIYIDVKSLYDNSIPNLPAEVLPFATEELNKYLLYTNLIKEIILETKERLKDFVEDSILRKILGFDYEKIVTIRSELDLIEGSIKDVIKNIDLSLITSFKNTHEEAAANAKKGAVDISKDFKLSGELSSTKTASLKQEFETTLITYLDIKKSLIGNLIKLKQILEIDHLYIFLDDYSEIEEDAQKVFMDWFIAPLNNLSDDFVKFKIAVYPNRFYYGKLDNSKIDEISLDFFDAYYTFEKKANISKMETLALDYTRRLLTKRLNLFFPKGDWMDYFTIEPRQFFDILFSVSFNNPRKIGFILSYCYESCLIHDVRISIEAIENASQRYYTDVILKYFLANQFVTKPFSDKISNGHQYELLKKIIDRQKSNASSVYRTKIKGKPANHFTTSNSLTHLLENLELNGFITTYNCNKDGNEELSTVYSLDYGLCKRYDLNFSRACDDRLNKYFALPRFNMNVLVVDYFNKTQVIRCNNGHEYPFSMHETLQNYKMKCPECLENDIITKCEVVISNEEILEKLKSIENPKVSQTTFNEFIILDYLKTTTKTVSIAKISSSLDKGEVTVKQTINKLQEKGLVTFDIEASRKLKKDYYSITEKGVQMLNKILDLLENIYKESKTAQRSVSV